MHCSQLLYLMISKRDNLLLVAPCKWHKAVQWLQLYLIAVKHLTRLSFLHYLPSWRIEGWPLLWSECWSVCMRDRRVVWLGLRSDHPHSQSPMAQGWALSCALPYSLSIWMTYWRSLDTLALADIWLGCGYELQVMLMIWSFLPQVGQPWRRCWVFVKDLWRLQLTVLHWSSKTKCLYLFGHMDAVYPSHMQLCGRDLPWLQHATHLGHELHQMCNMEFDANVKRVQCIESSVKIQ